MTLQEAVKSLNEELRPYDWFMSVGAGDKQIHLFLKKKPFDKRKVEELKQNGYEGFPVSVKITGQFRAGPARRKK